MTATIATSFDENYLKVAGVFLKTLANNTSSTVNVVCLVPKDIMHLQESYVKFVGESKLNIEFRYSEAYEDLVKNNNFNFDRFDHITQNAMQRVFLASTLHEYDRVVYIDPDTIITRDISPILDYPVINGIAAVVEYNNVESMVFGTSDRPYFNNGIFITNLSYWRDNQIEEKMLSWALSHEPTMCLEQDLMNRFLFDAWSPLPITFNFAEVLQFSYESVYANPLIVHFVGPRKPWLENSLKTKWSDEWGKIYLTLPQTL